MKGNDKSSNPEKMSKASGQTKEMHPKKITLTSWSIDGGKPTKWCFWRDAQSKVTKKKASSRKRLLPDWSMDNGDQWCSRKVPWLNGQQQSHVKRRMSPLLGTVKVKWTVIMWKQYGDCVEPSPEDESSYESQGYNYVSELDHDVFGVVVPLKGHGRAVRVPR